MKTNPEIANTAIALLEQLLKEPSNSRPAIPVINTELITRKLCTVRNCLFQMPDQHSETHVKARNIVSNLLLTMDLYRC